ncbi:hypothetical protein [Luteimonas salinisoli]|nr:hypothetical protein [Luteimonas salinisoli]
MLHIVASIERRFSRHGRGIVVALLSLSSLALVAGLVLATNGAR